MKRAIAAIVAVVIVGAGIWWFVASHHKSAASGKQPSIVSAATVQYFQNMEATLNKGTVTQQSVFVANEVRDGFLAAKQSVVPKGSSVSFKISTDGSKNTFKTSKSAPNVATVEFTLNTPAAGGKTSSQDQIMVLARETNSKTHKSSWLIVYTEVKK